MMSYDYPHPTSRTYQYKKVTKPLLERKRRARINRCLDELKDLMVDALETEGENISKLEKADILELTVRHLQRIHASKPLVSPLSSGHDNNIDTATAESRWKSGFGQCASEACRYLASLPDESGERLARHLATGLQSTQNITPQIIQSVNPETTPPLASNSKEISDLSASPGLARDIPQSRLLSSLSFSHQQRVSPLTISPPNSEYSFAFDNNNQSQSTVSNKTEKNNSFRNQIDDEDIDIEQVDERDHMWRPW